MILAADATFALHALFVLCLAGSVHARGGPAALGSLGGAARGARVRGTAGFVSASARS